MIKQPEFVCVATLKSERRYTDKIVRLLGEPDKYAPNPHYKCAPEMKLYGIERVLEFEKTPEFQEAFANSRKRSESAKKSAKKGVITKTKQTCSYALLGLTIDLPDLTEKELTKIACEHYNQLRDFSAPEMATPRSDKNFLKRITVNYLRHMCSDYDESLDDLRGQVRKDLAYLEVREKVEESIYERYPYLL